MKTNTLRPRGFTLVELLVVIVIIAALAGLSAPMILKQRSKADRIQATSNAKNLGIALFEFDEEFQSFPDNDTAETVAEVTGKEDLSFSGSSSNDYLRQLIAYNVDSEEIFFAKTSYTRKPDNNIVGPEAFKAGEVGFGYVMLDQTTGQNSSGNSQRPVLVTPLLDAQENWEFDPDPFDGKAVILKLDQSATSLQIRDSDKKISVGNGKTIDQTGEGTSWGTSIQPVLRAPSKRGS